MPASPIELIRIVERAESKNPLVSLPAKLRLWIFTKRSKLMMDQLIRQIGINKAKYCYNMAHRIEKAEIKFDVRSARKTFPTTIGYYFCMDCGARFFMNNADRDLYNKHEKEIHASFAKLLNNMGKRYVYDRPTTVRKRG